MTSSPAPTQALPAIAAAPAVYIDAPMSVALVAAAVLVVVIIPVVFTLPITSNEVDYLL